MEEIKNALKAARDAINQKDFESAVKSSKLALKKDKNNYMALVMLGVALQDSDQALLAFKKAISINNDKVLAWQGLEKFYEKIESPESWNELIDIYTHLLPLEEDLIKYSEICTKFLNVALKLKDVIRCGNILFNQYSTSPIEKQNVLYVSLTKLLTDSELEKNDKTFILLQQVLDNNNLHDSNNAFVLKYFDYVNCTMGFTHLFTKELIKLSNISQELKEFICKTYIEKILLTDAVEIQHSDILPVVEEFLASHTNTKIHNFVEAGLFYHKMDYYNAFYISNTLLANDKENDILTILVAKCCLKLQRWLEAEKLSQPLIKSSNEALSTNALKILLVAMSNQNIKEKCNKALDLKAKFETVKLGSDEYLALFTAYLFLDMLGEAENCLLHLQDSQMFLPCKARLLKKNGNSGEAFHVLDTNKESTPSCWLELGLFYKDKKDYQNSLIPFLQAAKYDKFNFSVFLYLGDYYRLCDLNIEKATKCYQKSFTLNSESAIAGKSLSNAYRYLENWDVNYDFLKNVTKSNLPYNTWAWLALGLHHLALEQWDEAIVNLRTFVRLHPNDSEAWESLADAYYSRGSYSSGLKCYQRATELDGSRKYSQVQIGTVQCLLGQFKEANITYKSIDDDQYIPALKGFAEVKLCIAMDKFSQNLFGCCRENAQEAIDLVTAAILKENRFMCLWKVLSTAVSVIARLPYKYRWLFINSKFNNEDDANKLTFLTEAGVFLLAIRCLCKGITLSPTFSSYLYHDLATVYLDYYKCYGNQNNILKAYAAIKRCISSEQSVWQYWNTLGVVCMSKGIKKYAIAQHAFIKALNLDSTNSIIWCNLGLFYLHFNKTMLSNKSFQRAQQFDPSHLQSWIGQALVAESVGHEDAMDLFRHSAELGFHRESSLGYGEWVCKTLTNAVDQNKSKIEYSINNMHAIPVACDLLTWLSEYESDDACCLNIYGILLEKMGLHNKAFLSFEKALSLSDPKYKDILLLNCGRILYHLGKYDNAIEMFKSVSEASLHSACGLALSLYKCEHYEESFAVYSTALQWLANNDKEKSELLVAMAGMAYKFQGIDDCKTLLFQSVQLNKEVPSIAGLLSIYSIGVLHSEQALSNLVIDELRKLNNSNAYNKYIGFFESYILLKENPIQSIKKIIEHIHRSPDNTYLWEHLSKYCVSESNAFASLASKSAQKVILLGESKENINKNYRVASIAEMILNNLKESIKLAQMAVHMYPNNAENWALLLSILLPKSGALHIDWIKNLLQFIKTSLNPNKPLRNWLDFFERHCGTLARV